ncbi:hypothetical protein Lesp02_07540 [Lentzea sp. NBRC 105346]|uniref:hypothetical protein n=1 Tax=Lentzea sp. NBRC 105346 TaxID=3032205 RepID=UPI0024A32D97|nr:hypothetical protein [Lentzea sp. NBRC 105346]GLZ28564.1 hypothetical protein Lesp02_07540 [Lentzea sp. NBRC 105346]
MRILLLTVAFLAAFVTPAEAGAVHVVTVTPQGYQPLELQIKVGDRVKWVFKGPGVQNVRKGLDPARPCKATGQPNSGPREPGQSYTHRFTRSGRVTVFDEVTGCREELIGTIHVD